METNHTNSTRSKRNGSHAEGGSHSRSTSAVSQKSQTRVRQHREAEPQSTRHTSADYTRRPRRKKKKPIGLLLCAFLLLLLAGALIAFAFKGMLGTKAGMGSKTETPALTPTVAESVQAAVMDEEPEVLTVEERENAFTSSFTSIAFSQYPDVRCTDGKGFYAAVWDGTQQSLYKLGLDGSAVKLSEYSVIQAKTNPGNYVDFYSGSVLEGLVANGDRLISLESIYTSYAEHTNGTSAGEEGYANSFRSEKQWFVRALDSNGKEISRSELTAAANLGMNGNGMHFGSDGKLYIISDSGIFVNGTDGANAQEIPFEGTVAELIQLRDGRVAAAGWTAEGYALYVINIESGILTKVFSLPENTEKVLGGFGAYDFYYSAMLNCYGGNLATGEADELFNWTEMGISNSTPSCLAFAEEKIYAIDSAMSTVGNHCDNTLIAITEQTNAQKKTGLILASADAGPELQQMVAAYNRKNQTKVRLVRFNAESEEPINDLYSFAASHLDGRMPDIIDMTGISYYELASKGIAEDLTSYLKKSPELLPNVRAALTVNGAIYQVSPGFSISTVIGDSRVVGNGEMWNYDAYAASLEKMNEGCLPFGSGVTAENILYNMTAMHVSELIDWKNGSADFNNANYSTALQVAKTVPAEAQSSVATAEELIANRQQMLVQKTLFTYDDILTAGVEFGGYASIVGYPAASGSNHVLNLVPGLAMNSNSGAKDAAWEFMRTYLSEEYQNSFWCFPSTKAAFDTGLSSAKNERFETDDNNQHVRIPRAVIYDDVDSQSVREVYALTEENAAKLQSLVNNTTIMSEGNVICDIAVRSARNYLSGTSTAETAAETAQEQVNVYLQSIK